MGFGFLFFTWKGTSFLGFYSSLGRVHGFWVSVLHLKVPVLLQGYIRVHGFWVSVLHLEGYMGFGFLFFTSKFHYFYMGIKGYMGFGFLFFTWKGTLVLGFCSSP